MKENGVLILNGDDELLSGLEGLLPMPITFYGINEYCNMQAYGIESLGKKGSVLQLISGTVKLIYSSRSPVFIMCPMHWQQ